MTLRDRKPMRQGQQNRRGRGRNRKSQNPLTRSFESNGPDVKIRGTPAHVAEKYMNLARDALSSGDRVLAENYLQHAEHYNRIIMAFRESQSAPQPDAMNGAGRTGRQPGLENDDDQNEDERSEATVEAESPQPQRQSGSGNGGSRSRQQRGSRRQPARDRSAESEQSESGRSQGRGGEQNKAARFGGADDQPEFLRRPVRRTRRDSSGDGEQPEVETVSDEEKAD